MGRTKLNILAAALCVAVAAGCSAPPKSAPPDPAKIPPGMKFGYKPPQ